ncbi:MAG: hypothetical protein EKK49_02900, partial [Rhodocyclaceae bacterium]
MEPSKENSDLGGWHDACWAPSTKGVVMAETKSTCCYCGVGCGVVIEHEAGRITGVR